MRILLALFFLLASCGVGLAQGCGPSNPNCIVPTAPLNTNNNQAASTAFVQNQIAGGAIVPSIWPNDVYFGSGRPWVDIRSGTNGCAAAKGDGATDDTSAIQCQINFMNSTYGGGIVNVPPGTYLVSAGGITIKGGVQLYGAGPASSTIEVLTDSVVITFDAVTCTKYPAIRNLFIKGYQNAAATHDTVSVGANCPAIVYDSYVWFGKNAINTAGVDVVIFNTFACAYNDAIKSSGAGWYVRVKMDSGCGAGTGTNGFEQVAGSASVEENHFSESDFDGAGYTNSVLINDGVGTQAITHFDNSIFSAPITITNALFTSFSKAEFGSTTFSASGFVSIVGSIAFSTTTPSGGTVTCAGNDAIVCPLLAATIQNSTITLRNTTGSPVTVDCGVAGASSCTLSMAGFSTGSWFLKPAAAASGGITMPAGTTDFTSTGGASQVVQQTSSGGPFTVGQLACGSLSDSTLCNASSPLAVTSGGTHLATLTAHGLIIGEGTGNPAFVGPCNSNVPITGQGGSSDPQCGGTIPVGNGGTGDTGTAWATFTPTISCGTGSVSTYTTQNGRYKTIGKTVFLSVNIKVNNAGTCSGTITIAGLPVTAGANNYIVAAFDSTSNTTLSGFIANGGSTIGLFTATGGNPTATDIFNVGGTLEST